MSKLLNQKGPHLRSTTEAGGNTTNKIMINVLVCLLVVYAFSFWKNGIVPFLSYDNYIDWVNSNNNVSEASNIISNLPNRYYILLLPIINLIVSLIVAVSCEAIFFKLTERVKTFEEGVKFAITKSYALIPPIILLLIRPTNTPIFVVVIVTILMVFLSKMLFGGFGKNIFNPAAIGAALYAGIYGGMISKEYGGWFNFTNDHIDFESGATALENAQRFNWVGTYDTVVGPFGTLLDFLFGNIPGSLGETSALLIIIMGIYLLIKKAITWEIPVIYVLTIFVSTWIIGIAQGIPGDFGAIWYPTFHILSGGVIFGAVFMFTEPVTSPISTRGRFIYAFFGGIITVLVRILAGTPEGVATAIVTMNLLTVAIDRRASIIQAVGTNKQKLISLALILITGALVILFVISRLPSYNATLVQTINLSIQEMRFK